MLAGTYLKLYNYQRFRQLTPYLYHGLHYAPLQGIGSWHRQLIAVTCIAEHASAATYTNAHALAKPQVGRADAERCRKASREVLAGCSKA